jgi:4-hydroxymandelate oxidase
MDANSSTKAEVALLKQNRRAFLKFLAASPYVAMLASSRLAFSQSAPVPLPNPYSPNLISSPKEALEVMDFSEPARRNMIMAHWGYLSSGTDGDATVGANRKGFDHFQLRTRRLVGAVSTKVNTATELFGTTYDSPIFLSPIGGHKTYHPEGEIAVARAAKNRNDLMILSTPTTSSVEDVARALGRAPWYQLYAPSAWPQTEQLVRRVEAAGCPVLVVTVDNITGRNMVTFNRARQADRTNCSLCHKPGDELTSRPMFQGIDMKGLVAPDPALDWAFIDRLRKATKLKLVIKGLDTREDARLCLDHGVDGILVSNHGGRATDTGRATIDALAEVIDGVNNRIPVMIDSGFRRGSDLFKALALGARAVGIGRPYIWGLGSFGEAGVDRVLEILQAELRITMAGCGAKSIKEITPAHITQQHA